MLDQAYYLDASKVNRAVEYPNQYEIAPPFGVEQMQAVAFTAQPDSLATVAKEIDGEKYQLVATTEVLVKHRGLRLAKGVPQFAEAVLVMTTLPKP